MSRRYSQQIRDILDAQPGDPLTARYTNTWQSGDPSIGASIYRTTAADILRMRREALALARVPDSAVEAVRVRLATELASLER